MYQHPEDYLSFLEQDRERRMAQKALERAAREGGEQHPAVGRGGISGFAKVLRAAASAVVHARPVDPRQTTPTTGPSGI
jgi:hypothetical protein